MSSKRRRTDASSSSYTGPRWTDFSPDEQAQIQKLLDQKGYRDFANVSERVKNYVIGRLRYKRSSYARGTHRGGTLRDDGTRSAYNPYYAAKSKGVRLTRSSASFLQAHCSPFTNPSAFPGGRAVVPDPAFQDDSFSSRLILRVTGECDSDGRFFVSTIGNPFVNLPFMFTGLDEKCTQGFGSTSGHQRPGYRVSGMAHNYPDITAFLSRLQLLSRECASFRIVGHGLKVWVADDVGAGKAGNVRGGSFEPSVTEMLGDLDTNFPGSSAGQPFGSPAHWSFLLGGSNTGDYSVDGMIRAHHAGSVADPTWFPASQGTTVRWCADPTISYPCECDIPFYSGTFGFPNNRGSAVVGVKLPNLGRDGNSLYSCISSSWHDGTGDVDTQMCMPYDISDTGTDSSVVPYTNNGLKLSLVPSTRNPSPDGCYAVVEGCEANTTVTMQMVWHLECVPNQLAPCPAMKSAVDPNWNIIATMAMDKEAFPKVVKGHSFFKKLLPTLRKMAPDLIRAAGQIPVVGEMIDLVKSV